MNSVFCRFLLAATLLLSACGNPAPETTKTTNDMQDWKNKLETMLPLLGHRNWIVVTDMAYPLQTNPGITTLVADEPFAEVIATVNNLIGHAPHVFPHIYLDEEQGRLSEELAPGWNNYQKQLSEALPADQVQHIGHEQIIRRLDEAANLFQVVIIKTKLTIPYTSVFFELDCRYWDAQREDKIRSAQ